MPFGIGAFYFLFRPPGAAWGINMTDLFRIGVIANTHGIKGEVKVFPTTGEPDRYNYLKEVILDTGKEKKTLEVTSARFFKNLVIVKFKGIDNINDIEKYKGCELFVTRENAIPLEDGECYIADMYGMKVVTDQGEDFGILKDVMETGANLVFVVMHEGKEVLLPDIPECVKEVNIEENRITVHIMKGLLD